MRIWIDTDIGSDVDDALALAYVLRHPGFELAGISTVFGDVELRTQIAQALLGVAKAPPVPILTGLGVPLTPRRKGLMFGHEGTGILENPEPRLRTDSEPDGAHRIERLAEAVEQAAADILLAIGPLTNLGGLVRAGATLPPLAIMGGKLEDVLLPGMTAHVSEWNWFCDPLAVQQVLAATHRVRPRVVPAEVTFRTSLPKSDVERLSTGDALSRSLGILCEHWLRAQVDLLGSKRPGLMLHDPLTAAILAEPSLCPFEERHIRVDDSGAAHREGGPANIDAAVDVDPGALRDHLMRTWLGSR